METFLPSAAGTLTLPFRALPFRALPFRALESALPSALSLGGSAEPSAAFAAAAAAAARYAICAEVSRKRCRRRHRCTTFLAKSSSHNAKIAHNAQIWALLLAHTQSGERPLL